jgi:fermentation-respiration switch protein FrsA (DUF1100 family)
MTESTNTGILPRSVQFRSGDHQLHGEILWPKPVSDRTYPAAILCHGLGSDGRAMRPSAMSLAQRGIMTLVFDFHGHGQSCGVCDGQLSQDVVSAVTYFAHWPQVDKGRIALVGHSMGARSAILAVPETLPLKALVALACPGDEQNRSGYELEDFYRQLPPTDVVECPAAGPLPWLGTAQGLISRTWMWLRGYELRINWRRSLEVWSRLKASLALSRINPIPLLFVHCQGDREVPYQDSVSLYEQANPPKDLYITPGGFHSAPLLPGRVRERWMNWLIAVLKESQRPGGESS